MNETITQDLFSRLHSALPRLTMLGLGRGDGNHFLRYALLEEFINSAKYPLQSYFLTLEMGGGDE